MKTLLALAMASNFVSADVEAWKSADELCQPPTRNEEACQHRADIDVALYKSGLRPFARPSKGPYWEVYWK